jgi:hypothetical protein
MVSKVRLRRILHRRLIGANHRKDSARAATLQCMISTLDKGRESPGSLLIQLQAWRKPRVSAPAVVRLAGKLPFTPKSRTTLKGGL